VASISVFVEKIKIQAQAYSRYDECKLEFPQTEISAITSYNGGMSMSQRPQNTFSTVI